MVSEFESEAEKSIAVPPVPMMVPALTRFVPSPAPPVTNTPVWPTIRPVLVILAWALTRLLCRSPPVDVAEIEPELLIVAKPPLLTKTALPFVTFDAIVPELFSVTLVSIATARLPPAVETMVPALVIVPLLRLMDAIVPFELIVPVLVIVRFWPEIAPVPP